MNLKISRSRSAAAVIIIFVLILNIISWSSKVFSDWYSQNILDVWVSGVSRFVSLFRFSLGEAMIVCAVFFTAAAPLSFICLIKVFKNKRKTIKKIYADILIWITVFIFTMLTLNCFIMYHCTSFSDRYFSDSNREYSADNLIDVYDMVTMRLNELSCNTARDEDGFFVLSDDLYENAYEAMNNISDRYPQLSGYYPRPKPIYNSGFMSQQYTMGVFFPFSLEANYNTAMHEVNVPETVCHEYAHLKGYMQEDEAGFISYIACINSESTDFRYSGYLSMLGYIEQEVHSMDATDEQWQRIYQIESSVNEYVRTDNIFLKQEKWNDIEETAVISTDVVGEISGKLTDVSLKVNGVKDGMQSYSRKVSLLLDYYF